MERLNSDAIYLSEKSDLDRSDLWNVLSESQSETVRAGESWKKMYYRRNKNFQTLYA